MENNENADFQPREEQQQFNQSTGYQQQGGFQQPQGNYPYKSEKKTTAGILGILLGGFGVHKFFLGYTTEGIIQIVITIVTCGLGSLVGLVEGIIYLTKGDEEFDNTYVKNKKGWF